MGCIVARCNQCKIEIRDNVSVCPLCGCVPDDVKEQRNRYPNIRHKDRKIDLVTRIYLFAAILAEVLLVYFNVTHFKGIYWSAITGGAFAYAYLTMRFAILHNAGYKAKLIIQTIFGVMLLILIDWAGGYRGWSFNYVLPAGIILLDLAIVVLMIVNSRNWQSYILFQLVMIVLSLLPIGFYELGIVTEPFVSMVALAASVLLFVGTLIIGGRRASAELKRRFHVR